MGESMYRRRSEAESYRPHVGNLEAELQFWLGLARKLIRCLGAEGKVGERRCLLSPHMFFEGPDASRI
jgi:hypothetical protein